MAQPGLTEAVEAAVAVRTAGSPVDPDVQWTNRSPQEVAEQGFTACADTVRKILTDELGASRRQAVKNEAGSDYEFRDEQFQHIAARRAYVGKYGFASADPA